MKQKRSSSPMGGSDTTNDEELIHESSESGEEGASSSSEGNNEDNGFGSKDSGFQSILGHKERWCVNRDVGALKYSIRCTQR